ncbi:hypothetical protein X975_01271, partial [Stegodyphus mimosarum]
MNSELSCNILDYSSADSCSEFSSDEDSISARNFIETDVENPPPPCPQFNFTGSSQMVNFEGVLTEFSTTSEIQMAF